MVEKIIDDINYRLYEETMTAYVIAKKNGYEGDVIIPKTIVVNDVTYLVTSIDKQAFSCCNSLTAITIPYCVTSIGWHAFWFCKRLKSISIPDSVSIIGDSAFCGCKLLKSIVIGNGVMSIGKWAFSRCTSLESVVIGNSVTNIEWWAFSRCKSLTDITFQGTMAQWNEIDFGNGWNDEVPTEVIHCTDGDVEI